MAGEIYIAKQSTLEEVKSTIGSASDSGDTTAMGKLNKIISSAEGGLKVPYEGSHVIAEHSGGKTAFSFSV